MRKVLNGLELHPNQTFDRNNYVGVQMGMDTLNDEFAEKTAATLRTFIEHITPIVDDLENESGEADEP